MSPRPARSAVLLLRHHQQRLLPSRGQAHPYWRAAGDTNGYKGDFLKFFRFSPAARSNIQNPGGPCHQAGRPAGSLLPVCDGQRAGRSAGAEHLPWRDALSSSLYQGPPDITQTAKDFLKVNVFFQKWYLRFREWSRLLALRHSSPVTVQCCATDLCNRWPQFDCCYMSLMALSWKCKSIKWSLTTHSQGSSLTQPRR